MTDAASQLKETATYCKPHDPKRPGLVGLPDATTQQVCPADGSAADENTSAYPDGWYVRIMFDELLDPSIETLTEVLDDTGAGTGTFTGSIATTHPVNLQCESVAGGMVNVDYDGYYSPAGNAVTWPLGPSLVIKPNDPKLIATNKECQVTINSNVTDKDGNTVPAGDMMPFKFKIAPIRVISLDPTDDPDYKSPIDANHIYFDNADVMFNTVVTLDSLCPDADRNGLCDDEKTFSIKDVAHPNEGPGYCNNTGAPCGSLADCDTTGATPDTVCGRGFCSRPDQTTPCNVAADCPTAGGHCSTNYAYTYDGLGGGPTEYGLGPPEPIETEHKYIFSFTGGAKLTDRCGAESTLPAPTADNLELAHFITNKFDFKSATIATGETASAMKRLQFNWNNVLEGSDFASGPTNGLVESPAIDASSATPAFTISPLPKVLTGPCPGNGACPLTDIGLNRLLLLAPDGSGQVQLAGHYQLNTEYTATLKAGTVVKDFYGKSWTNTSDKVIKWKTQPSILLTSVSFRYTGSLVSVAGGGTITQPMPTNTTDIRLNFNASMDPTTLDLSEVTIEPVGDSPAPGAFAIASASGCGYVTSSLATGDNRSGYIGACALRLRGLLQKGTYKVTVKAGASFKDIFGATYTQAADQSTTITIAEAAPPVQCL